MGHIKYPSIGVYGTAIRELIANFRYSGRDVNGDPVYDHIKILPVIWFTGTVKIHGTNASVCYDVETGEIIVQSRRKVLTVGDDNAGFACFVEKNKDAFQEMFDRVIKCTSITEGIITIFGEWCGKGIQSGCGIHQIDKTYIIFGCKHTINPDDEELKEVNWIDFYTDMHHDSRIYHINWFDTYEIDIDLNDPKLSQNKLVEITNEVEKECPVAKKLGATVENGSMIGEGVVWTTRRDNGHLFRFKVKGEKHSASKVKSLAPVDIEKMNNVKEFVDYAVTVNRLEQGIQEVFVVNNLTPDIKLTGNFLKWIVTDVMKEEIETLVASGLVAKDVTSAISNKGRKWFFENYINL